MVERAIDKAAETKEELLQLNSKLLQDKAYRAKVVGYAASLYGDMNVHVCFPFAADHLLEGNRRGQHVGPSPTYVTGSCSS